MRTNNRGLRRKKGPKRTIINTKTQMGAWKSLWNLHEVPDKKGTRDHKYPPPGPHPPVSKFPITGEIKEG